jgi:lipoate-protein ligase A
MNTPIDQGSDVSPPTVEAELAHDLELLALAAEHGRPTFKTWATPRLTVVVGRAVDIASEVDVERCERLDIPIVRRPSGGRSVVIGPGTVQYTFALPYRLSAELGGISSSKRFCNRLLLGGLADSRVAEDESGDLLVGDRKVGGLAIKRGRDAMMLHGTLLACADIDAVASLLRHPLREPPYRRGRSHADFLLNLGPIDPASLALRVCTCLAELP